MRGAILHILAATALGLSGAFPGAAETRVAGGECDIAQVFGQNAWCSSGIGGGHRLLLVNGSDDTAFNLPAQRICNLSDGNRQVVIKTSTGTEVPLEGLYLAARNCVCISGRNVKAWVHNPHGPDFRHVKGTIGLARSSAACPVTKHYGGGLVPFGDVALREKVPFKCTAESKECTLEVPPSAFGVRVCNRAPGTVMNLAITRGTANQVPVGQGQISTGCADIFAASSIRATSPDRIDPTAQFLSRGGK
jgi:hypothetical protein